MKKMSFLLASLFLLTSCNQQIYSLKEVTGFESFSLIFKGNIESYFEDDLDDLWFSSASIVIDKDKQICFSIDDYSSKEELNKTKVTRIYADSLKIDYKFDFDFK